jgi:hypothetical protein
LVVNLAESLKEVHSYLENITDQLKRIYNLIHDPLVLHAKAENFAQNIMVTCIQNLTHSGKQNTYKDEIEATLWIDAYPCETGNVLSDLSD